MNRKTGNKLHCGTTLLKGISLLGIATILCVCQSGAALRNEQEATREPLLQEEIPTATPDPTEEPVMVDETVACGSFVNPTTGVLTSAFGQRWGRMHEGIDIGGEENAEILAADAGKVIYSDWMDGYGNYIIIDHENGYQTAYGHCSKLLVFAGDRVRQGQKIALMGSTGNSTGVHLHFEIKENGEYIQPLDFVQY